MGKRLDLTGQRFGRLVVIGEAPDYIAPAGQHHSRWRCQCDCGLEVVKKTTSLLGRRLKKRCGHSCGTPGGRTNHPLYGIWRGMISRCTQPCVPCFPRYGGRGIEVCPEWSNSFEQFCLDMGPRPTLRHQVERYDNDGPYASWNCGWEPPLVQANNKCTTLFVDAGGERLTIREIVKRTGLAPATVRARIRRGWDAEELFAPYGTRRDCIGIPR